MFPTRPTRMTFEAAAGTGVVVVLVAGIVLRLYTRSDLWLDEALSVNIARLPLGDLFEQLRHDGHPPLYYVLLHGWMELFGEGDVAVRSLSAVFGILALPLMWLTARWYGGRATGVAAVVLLATSPFAVRYATETRMYSLVMCLVLAGWLLVRAALDRPALSVLTAIAVVSGALALTHYWSFYLLAATGIALLWRWRRGSAAALRAAAALVAGAVLFLPWLPSFLEQAAHTGTPWGRPQRPTSVLFVSFTDWGGGPNGEAQMLGTGLLLLVLLGLVGRAVDDRRIELDLTGRSPALVEAVVAILTMGVAVVAAYATSSAFASRYTAVVFPLVLLLAALGTLAFADLRVRAGVLLVLSLLGLVGAVRNVTMQRTQGGDVADYIAAHGEPGDVVAFCPDQLGPAASRDLPDGFVGMTFPLGDDPQLVDWVDYEERQAAAEPADYARLVHERAGDGTVWMVWAPGYRTLGRKCERTTDALRQHRPGGRAVVSPGSAFEPMWLYQYGPVPG